MVTIKFLFQVNIGRIFECRYALTGFEPGPRRSGKVILVMERDVSGGTTSFLNIKPGFFQYLLDKTYSGINKFLTCCSI